MKEKQYKLCPNCHNWNEARAIECLFCQADLTNIRPQRKDTNPQEKQQTSKEKAEETKGKICTECGYINPPQTRKCLKCKSDLSDVIVKTVKANNTGSINAASSSYILETLEHKPLGELTAKMDEMIIGREYQMSDYLANKMYVSRKQASITSRDGKYYIKNLSRSNPTFVNNQELKTGEERLLSTNDEIGLGGKIIDGKRQDQAAYLFVREKK